MERELEKDLKEIEYLIYVHKNRGNTNTQSVLERVHEIIEPCAKAARTLSELEALLFRENGQGTTRSSRDKDGWIPVEERLPEGRTRVICQFDNGDIELLWQEWENDPESLTYWTDFDFMAEKKVIAWRPLPEPYRPERSRENEK